MAPGIKNQPGLKDGRFRFAVKVVFRKVTQEICLSKVSDNFLNIPDVIAEQIMESKLSYLMLNLVTPFL